METKHQAELAGARSEKEKLQRLVSRQSGTIEELEKSLLAASTNTSLLQHQQLQLLESVQSLVRLVSQGRGEPRRAGRVQAAGELFALLRGCQGAVPAPGLSSGAGDFTPKMSPALYPRSSSEPPGEGPWPDAVPSHGKSPGLGWWQPRCSTAASPSPRETAQKKEK